MAHATAKPPKRTTANPRSRDMTKTWAGRDAAVARRKAAKAIAELDSQGYTVISPEGAVVCGKVPATI